MARNTTLAKHYSQLLGLSTPWRITSIDMDAAKQKIDISIEWPAGKPVRCPECGKSCSLKDHREERIWRHLDTMQFKTLLHCRIPRSECPVHGALTIDIPWGETKSRWTLLFETFAIEVLTQVPAIAKAARLLGLSWDETFAIKKRGVQRGLERRSLEDIQYLGIDEKSFTKKVPFITVLNDLHGERVIDVAPTKSAEAGETVLSVIPKLERPKVDAVAMDMTAAYKRACLDMLENAEIVYDKYHIEQGLSKAVGSVRHSEHKKLMSEGITVLKNTRFLWLRRPERWNKEQKAQFQDIQREYGETKLAQSKIGRAWTIKEAFRPFWNYVYPGVARQYFQRWYFWATHSRIRPIIEIARTLKTHLDGILTYFHHGITNAFSEGINSKIQDLKSGARGFRSFDNYRIAILFSCGKLDMKP